MKGSDFMKSNVLLLKQIESRLSNSRIMSARPEAEVLVRHFGKMGRIELFAGEKALTAAARNRIHSASKARLRGKPIAYLLKETEFFGHRFFVTENALIPRPETEFLVQEALRLLDRYYPAGQSKVSCHCERGRSRGEAISSERSPRALCALAMTAYSPAILDLGTGSGCIAVSVTLERPDCRMTALDVSSSVLKIARKNIKYHYLGKKIALVQSDLFGAFGKEKKAYWDMIVSNPPYVPEEDLPGLPKEGQNEPRLALNGGAKGFLVIDKILDQAPHFLKSGGWLLMEIGQGQSKLLKKKLLRSRFFGNLRVVKDFNGIDRILVIQKRTVTNWTN